MNSKIYDLNRGINIAEVERKVPSSTLEYYFDGTTEILLLNFLNKIKVEDCKEAEIHVESNGRWDVLYYNGGKYEIDFPGQVGITSTIKEYDFNGINVISINDSKPDALKEKYITEIKPKMEKIIKDSNIPVVEKGYTKWGEHVKFGISAGIGIKFDEQHFVEATIEELREELENFYEKNQETIKKISEKSKVNSLEHNKSNNEEEQKYLSKIINNEVIADKSTAIHGVSIDGSALAFMSEELKKDKDIIENALGNNLGAWEYVDPNLKLDKDFILKLFKNVGTSTALFGDLAEKLRNDDDIIELVKKSGRLRYNDLGESAQKDEKLVLEIMKDDPYWTMKKLHPELRSNPEFIIKALTELSESLNTANRNDEYYNIYESRIELLNSLSEDLKKDEQFMYRVGDIGDGIVDIAYDCADEKLQKNKNFTLNMVKKGGLSLRELDEEWCKDADIVKAAIENDGDNFKYADDSFKDNDELISIAIKNSSGWYNISTNNHGDYSYYGFDMDKFFEDMGISDEKADTKVIRDAITYRDEHDPDSEEVDKEDIIAEIIKEQEQGKMLDDELNKTSSRTLEEI